MDFPDGNFFFCDACKIFTPHFDSICLLLQIEGVLFNEFLHKIYTQNKELTSRHQNFMIPSLLAVKNILAISGCLSIAQMALVYPLKEIIISFWFDILYTYSSPSFVQIAKYLYFGMKSTSTSWSYCDVISLNELANVNLGI